jgi:hypothetical protein
LHISWNHWVPKYIRDQIKKKTGIEVDEYGNRQEKEPVLQITQNASIIKDKPKKAFTPIDSYIPKGNLDDLFNKEYK